LRVCLVGYTSDLKNCDSNKGVNDMSDWVYPGGYGCGWPKLWGCVSTWLVDAH
jgi:hypothetical protein